MFYAFRVLVGLIQYGLIKFAGLQRPQFKKNIYLNIKCLTSWKQSPEDRSFTLASLRSEPIEPNLIFFTKYKCKAERADGAVTW